MNNINALAKEGKINENANIKDTHSIIMNSAIEKVWRMLIDIKKWHEWNKDIKQVKFEGNVEEGTDFDWSLGRVRIFSQIQKMTAPSTLSWTGKSKWVKSIFVWQLEPDDNQTIVSVSASMQGAFTILVNSHEGIHKDLISWLENLKNEVEA